MISGEFYITPLLALEWNLPVEYGAFCLSVAAVSLLVSRAIMLPVVGYFRIDLHTYICIACTATAIIGIIALAITSDVLLMCNSVIMGLFSTIFYPLLTPLIKVSLKLLQSY